MNSSKSRFVFLYVPERCAVSTAFLSPGRGGVGRQVAVYGCLAGSGILKGDPLAR